MKPETKKRRSKWFKRLIGSILILILGPLLMLASCQSSLIYFPRPYGNNTTTLWKNSTAGKTIDFHTSQGPQRAFLQGNLTSPMNLWIVCGGNGSLALDWSDWLAEYAPKQDAYVLVDFPGYGDCAGSPSPQAIRESFQALVPAATEMLGWPTPPAPDRLRIFGHSLGAAATLIAAADFKIRHGVLLTPFTSTMDMSKEMTGLPLGFIVWHRFDNSARLAEISTHGHGKMIIFHGINDEAIPISMSRTLASEQKPFVTLKEIPAGRHNTLQETHAAEIAAAMSEISSRP